MVNGVGDSARDFVAALETLTGRRDIGYLTMLRYQKILPQRGLLKSRRAWCPQCYSESQDTVLYDPLIWMLTVVESCPTHRRPLATMCPHCGRSLPVLDRKYRPGYCSRCLEWLGSQQYLACPTDAINVDSECTINSLKFLLSNEFAEEMLNDRNAAARGISILIDGKYDGSIARFAQEIGVPKSSAWGWASGKNRPPLSQLIRICQAASISASELLVPALLPAPQFKPLGPDKFHETVALQKTDTSDRFIIVKKSMATLAINGEAESVTKVAKRFGVNKRLLYQHLATECKILALTNRSNKAIGRLQKELNSFCEVIDAVYRLLTVGIYQIGRAHV